MALRISIDQEGQTAYVHEALVLAALQDLAVQGSYARAVLYFTTCC